MNYTILGVTILTIIVLLAFRQLWRQFQRSWGDIYVKGEKDDRDITELVPLAMRKSEGKLPKWD